MNLVQTTKGLPNSCYICGKKITTKTWVAFSVDDALAGLGGHKKCFVDRAKAQAEEATAAAKDLEALDVVVDEEEPEEE